MFIRITSGPMDPEIFRSSHSLEDPELKVSCYSVCVCVCVRACVRACMHARVHVYVLWGPCPAPFSICMFVQHSEDCVLVGPQVA